jgi:DNA mismatch repair protein MutS2
VKRQRIPERKQLMNRKTLKVLEYNKIIEQLSTECHSSLGSELVFKIEPVNEIHKIQSMLDETGEGETLLMQKGSFALEGLQDVTTLLRKAEVGSMLDPGQLLVIKRQLNLARKCKSHLSSFENRENIKMITQTVTAIQPARPLEERIEISILSDTEVSDQASLLLRQIRKQIQQKNEAVKSKLNQMIQSVKTQKYLQDSLVTIRQGRYVLPVKQEYKNMVQGLVHDQSSSGATLFIEPMAVVELNNQLKELKLKEELEIERILMELSGLVTEVSPQMRTNQEMMQLLDFFMAKGRLSIKMKAVAPQLTEKQEIVLKQGRHPLIKDHEVVPISLSLGEQYKTLIITGPNTGGKTVTLKTVGLFVLMAQSGLHVPADYGTRIGIFDHVFADIGDEQSIEQSLSTFSSHMTNIVEILNTFTDRSLVLLDELGAGTDPDEGAALAMAILNYLIQFSATVIATTHYSELKQYALMNEEVENACVEFDVATLSPTYRLLTGVPGKSNAFEISGKLGIKPSIIDDARNFLTTENVAFEDVLQTIERNRKSSDEDLIRTNLLRKQTEEMAAELRMKQQKFDEQKERMLNEARREAQQMLKNTKVEIEAMIQDMKKLQQETQNKEMNQETEKIRQRLRSHMNEISSDEDLFMIENAAGGTETSSLKRGDEVKIPSLNQTGSIISVDQDQQTASVQVGVMKMTLPLTGLTRIKTKQQKIQKGLQKIIQQKTESSKGEVDVRGTDLEEALYLVDKYLDDAYLSGRQQITIIHGIGTGVLKQGIQKMLKKHRLVKSHRDGIYGEGGPGVTIVTFKSN